MPTRGHYSLQYATTVVQLPDPKPGLQRSIEEVAVVQTTISGAERKQVTARRRVWSLAWQNVDDAAFAIVWGFLDGTNGNGPFLIFPPEFDTDPAVDPGVQVNASLSEEDTVNDFGFHNFGITLRETL